MTINWELALFFILFGTIVFIIFYDDRRINKEKKCRSAGNNLVSNTCFKSGIYWYRDYWSNRNCLGRNLQTEGLGWKNNEEFLIDFLGPAELKIDMDENGHLLIKNESGESIYSEIIEPTELIRKIEPQNTEIKEIFGFSLPIPSFDTTGTNTISKKLRNEDSVEKRLRSDKPPTPLDVYTEPMTQLKGSAYGPVKLIAISILAIWMVSIFLRFIFSIFSLAESLYMPALAFFIIVYSIIVAWKIISESTKKLKDASAFVQLYDGKNPTKFHYRSQKDVPIWLESKLYWVFSFIYTWKGELTAKRSFPFIYFKKDMERIEVWTDAKTGIMEWIATDYHYRELWYKADSGQSRINLLVLPNFHTLVPLNIALNSKEALIDLFTGNTALYDKWDLFKEKRQMVHLKSWVSTEIGGGSVAGDLVAGRLAILWWDYWRYPLGADNNLYKKSLEPSIIGKIPSANN